MSRGSIFALFLDPNMPHQDNAAVMSFRATRALSPPGRHEVAAANSAPVLYGHAQPRGVGRREHARGGRSCSSVRASCSSRQLMASFGSHHPSTSRHISPPEMFGADDAPQESRKSSSGPTCAFAPPPPPHRRHSRHIRYDQEPPDSQPPPPPSTAAPR